MSRRVVLAPLVLVWLMACASSGTRSPGQGSGRMSDPDFILREEIEEGTARAAYDLVRNLRPQWLQTRGLSTLRQAAGQEGIVVYLDNARLGGVEAMRRVTLGGVEYLRFYSASEATQRWGAGHLHGAILVSTRPR